MDHAPDILNHSIPRLLRAIAVPAGTGFFFNTMFNVVDTLYGGRISTQALAALSLSFPVFFLIIAMAAGISSGATALIGHALGGKRTDEARLYAAQTLSFAIVNGLFLTVAGWTAAPLLFRFMGASGDYLAMAVHYIRVIFLGATCFIVNHQFNAMLSSRGDTRSFRNFLIAAFFLNLVLDPWLLYGGLGVPALGLSGIGLGTVLIHGCGVFYMGYRARSTGLLEGFTLQSLVPRARPYRELARQSFPSALNMLTVAIGIFIITGFITRFGQDAVAAYGIATRIEQIVLLPVMGLNVATLSLVAQNSGARNYRRVRETVTTALVAGVSLMSIGSVLVFSLADPLMRLFTGDGAVVAVGEGYLHFAAFIFAAYVILYINVSALQGLRRPLFALGLGLFRQIAAPAVAFYLLAYALGMGLTGIWWGILGVTWCAAVISLAFTRWLVRGLAGEAAGA